MRNEAAVWDRFSRGYDAFMKRDMPTYRQIIQKTAALLKSNASVLEVATGTGILALGIAGSIDRVEAVDFSQSMIEKAREKSRQMGISNARFSVQDAYSLPYAADCFDAVIIANTLHIMPHPQKALAEIKRVLNPNGYLIAPTFVHAESKRAAVLSRLALITGFRAYHKWTRQSYCRFLRENGWRVIHAEILPASFPLAYCCCVPDDTVS